ncbi:MAG: type VI secretion system tube protein Hcp [Pirellulaceae bacterium]|nr:type VI secretion system tube protein Hcp [Pirellulaceae bacterium]
MKRPSKSRTSQVTPSRRSLRIESLEDRKLMTVAAEMVQMPQESQIGSEHWPEPAAEIAVEKVTNDRQGFFAQGWDNPAFRESQEIGFSRGLHNNGAFQEPTGHILWNTADNAGTTSDSYTDSGRVTYYAYELKNVQVVSIADQEANKEGVVEDDQNTSSYTEVEWTYNMQKKANLHNNGAFRSEVANENSFMAGADIVMEELEHGPGLHDSVHCLTGQHDRPGQLVEKLGGQEGEPVTDRSANDRGDFSHNPEWLRGQELVGGTMCSARASNDPIFFSHHANVDKVFSDSVLSQQLDKTSTNLQESCANGTFFSEVELNSVATIENNQEPYLTYKLKDVIVTS